MAALLPMAFWGLEVPAGEFPVPGRPEVPSAFRITMAAIDPSAEPEGEDGEKPRATLKILRVPLEDDEDDSDDEDDDEFDVEDFERRLAEAEDDDDDDEDDDEDDEEANGGPSDPKKSKAMKKAAAKEAIEKLLAEEGMDLDDDEPNGVSKSARAKGKMPASDEDEDEDDEDEDDEDGDEIEEFVLCTLDPEKHYQQPLDITIGENERVWFQVSGTHNIYLTGNYVDLPGENDMYDPDDEDEEDYDLEPDDDELDYDDEEDEDDELDDLDDPRITEVDEDEEEAPKLVKAADKKKKPAAAKAGTKRAAEESAGEETLDSLMDAQTNGEPKLSKKQQKKLKKNDGTAAEAKEEAPSSNKSDKKVQFAKELEQGPTPTKAKADAKKEAEKPAAAAAGGVKTVQGVKIDDRKAGTGPAAKKGDRVGMRYIGKLLDGKVFDQNKKGKPFSFKLGSGDVIKGWDIGIAGMAVGGERRITIPPHLAYGSKAIPGIPANSTLQFDVKLLELNKGK